MILEIRSLGIRREIAVAALQPTEPTIIQRWRWLRILRVTIYQIRKFRFAKQVSGKHPDFWKERCRNCWELNEDCRCIRSDA